MDKRRLRLIFCIVIIILLIAIVLILSDKNSGNRPYNTLTIDDIKKIEVFAWPPDKGVEISDRKQIQDLIDILHKLVIYEKDDSWKNYSGQYVQYTITRDDGDTTTIGAYNPFLIIDGIGYRTEYQPCEELSVLANLVIDNH